MEGVRANLGQAAEEAAGPPTEPLYGLGKATQRGSKEADI